MFAVRGTEATYEFVDLQKCDDSLLFFVLIDNDLMYFDFGLLVIQNKLKTVFVFFFLFLVVSRTKREVSWCESPVRKEFTPSPSTPKH